MNIENVIIHILDCEHNTCVTSNKKLGQIHPQIEHILQSKAKKVVASEAKIGGSFKEGSHIEHWLIQYKQGDITFEALSIEIANYIFSTKMKYAQYQSTAIIISEVVMDERRYIFVLDNCYHEGITHNVLHEGEDVVLDIVSYRTLLSTNFVKGDRAFFVELCDFSLHCVESKVEVEGEKMHFFADIVLESSTTPSYKEAITSISKITEHIANKYDLEEIELMPKMKGLIMDNVESKKPIQMEEVASVLFSDQPTAKKEFTDELRKQGIQNDIDVEYVKPSKSDKVQKIKTDKGIELTIPVDYMNSKEFIEIQNLPDGTIHIQLKNITHMTSK